MKAVRKLYRIELDHFIFRSIFFSNAVPGTKVQHHLCNVSHVELRQIGSRAAAMFRHVLIEDFWSSRLFLHVEGSTFSGKYAPLSRASGLDRAKLGLMDEEETELDRGLARLDGTLGSKQK